MANKQLNQKWEVLNSIYAATGNREDGKISKILLAIDESLKTHTPGQIQYDPITKLPTADTGITGVRISIGAETYIPFFNDTGGDIANGTPINAFGVNATYKVFNGIVANSTSPATSSAVIGLATHLVPDQTVGFATILGFVNDINTIGLTASGPVYLGVGVLTMVRPRFPANIVIMGSVIEVHATTGKVYSKPATFTRDSGSTSYSFTSAGVGAGIKYLGGFYDFALTDANLNQGSLTVLHGDANVGYSAHAACVFGGAGVVDSGVVGLRVNGTSIDDDGIRTPGDSEIITEDITSVALNEYIETPGKWVGTVTFELYVVSGAPTAYNVDFNHGYAKYEDAGNRDFTLRAFEVVGNAGANDVNFDIELLHHKSDGWTYAATNFIPGNGPIQIDGKDITFKNILGTESELSSGEPFAFKIVGINQYVDGNGSEGTIIRVTTNSPSSVQYMDAQLSAVSEDLI